MKKSKARSAKRKPKGARKKESGPTPRAPEGSASDAAPQAEPRSTGALPYALAVFGGALYFLGFAGFDLWPLAFVALVPLLWALELEAEARLRRVLAIGWVFGFVVQAGGYYWLIEMLEDFSGFSVLPNTFFASVLFSFQAIQWLVFAALYHRARRRGWPVLGVGLAVLTGLELVYPLLFPSYLANSLHQLPVFIQIVDLGGPILLSAVVMTVNIAVFELAWVRRHGGVISWKVPALAGAALLLTLGYGFFRVAQVDAAAAAAPHLTVGVIQANMGIYSKREDPLEGHRRHLDDTMELEAAHDLDLVVWSESAYTFFLRPGVTNVKRHVMGAIDTPLLFGGLSRREEHSYNTAFLAGADGEVLGSYDKTYLLAFGEYLPFGETFPSLYDLSPNSGHFTPGDHVEPMALGDYRITTLICYEDVLPGFTRGAVAAGQPHLLVNITNDAWFGDTNEPWIHLALAKFRAVEHHRALVRSTNSGVSAVIDPVGRVVEQSGVFTREALVSDVPMLDEGTVYETVGDWPGAVGVLAALWLAFGLRHRRL